MIGIVDVSFGALVHIVMENDFASYENNTLAPKKKIVDSEDSRMIPAHLERFQHNGSLNLIPQRIKKLSKLSSTYLKMWNSFTPPQKM